MKKKMKLDLNDLKVKSFVTSLDTSETGQLKGGTQISCPQNCLTTEFAGCTVSVHKICSGINCPR